MTRINIQFTRFSAFYSPLIATAAAGFLAEEGMEPDLSISPPGVSAIAALLDGSAHVVQSAPSQGLSSLEKGEDPPAVHFAQVNFFHTQMNFFLGNQVDDNLQLFRIWRDSIYL